LFAGYNHYGEVERLWAVMSQLPRSFHKLARYVNRASGAGLKRFVVSGQVANMLGRLWIWSDILSRTTDRSLYQLLKISTREGCLWLNDDKEPDAPSGALLAWERLPELLQRMMCDDLVSFLPDDILVKVDRAAMSVGLETRIPLLDHRIIEFACRLPASFKQRGRQGKWLLRQILYQHVPPALVDRPKRGFGAPIAEWLRGPLRDWAEQLLGETRLRQEGFFDTRQIRQRWQEHLSKKRNWSPGLWHVLMFQAWLDEQKTVPDQTADIPPVAPEKSLEAETCRP
jgi:asparagine synthase (glutamine-hydrolysing)